MKPEHDHEVASFALFTQSFDTLSETGQQDLKASPVQTSDFYHRSPKATPGSHPPRKIHVGGPRDADMGDISPIKLDDQQLPLRSSSTRHHSQQYQEHEDYRREATEHAAAYPALPREYPPAPHYKHGEEYKVAQASTYNAHGYSTTASNPFFVLRSVGKAFDQCTYKLPCLYDGEICPVNLRNHFAIRRFQGDHGINSRELEIARRRVDSALYAFGGYTTPLPRSHQSTIFRDRKSSAKEHYDNHFHRRYFVNGNHISWEMENNPPVLPHFKQGSDGSDGRAEVWRFNPNHGDVGKDSSNNSTSGVPSPGSPGSMVPMDNQQKMRYRCKLCGQLKQNHNCPYQQSLQRSIAVMVYPAVNAFTANEPGVLTKPLSEMNNFVSYDESLGDYYHGISPDHPAVTGGRITHVSPETATKTRLLHHSPESSLSTHSGHHQQRHVDDDPSPHRVRKRHHSQVDATTPPASDRVGPPRSTPYFVPSTLALRPEHFRAVTPRHKEKQDGSNSLVGGASEEYQYPHVPLTFQERKRLSDTLFFLSKEIPTMTAHVAPLLRMARENDQWDLAVSQVLAQLVVALYCGEGDYCLDGLQRYLLRLGIAC